MSHAQFLTGQCMIYSSTDGWRLNESIESARAHDGAWGIPIVHQDGASKVLWTMAEVEAACGLKTKTAPRMQEATC
jgi:hypothetical protein